MSNAPENIFNTEDILAVIKEVASHNNPHIEEYYNGRDSVVCDYCNNGYTAYGDAAAALASFEHNPSCVYLIAKDMLTRYQ